MKSTVAISPTVLLRNRKTFQLQNFLNKDNQRGIRQSPAKLLGFKLFAISCLDEAAVPSSVKKENKSNSLDLDAKLTVLMYGFSARRR